MTQKRRVVIVAVVLAAIGTLFIPGERSAISITFFRYLTRHPTALSVVSFAYPVTGNEEEFAKRIWEVIEIETLPAGWSVDATLMRAHCTGDDQQ